MQARVAASIDPFDDSVSQLRLLLDLPRGAEVGEQPDVYRPEGRRAPLAGITRRAQAVPSGAGGPGSHRTARGPLQSHGRRRRRVVEGLGKAHGDRRAVGPRDGSPGGAPNGAGVPADVASRVNDSRLVTQKDIEDLTPGVIPACRRRSHRDASRAAGGARTRSDRGQGRGDRAETGLAGPAIEAWRSRPIMVDSR